VSRALGDAWHTVECLIALLSTREDYARSVLKMQSWLSPIVCRILIPHQEDLELYERGIRLVDEFGGPPEWEESYEFIQMLQQALLDTKYCSSSERNFRQSEQCIDNLIILAQPHADQNGRTGCAWDELQIFCDKKGQFDVSSSRPIPSRKVYTCYVCHEPGDGFCWASNDDDAKKSPYCVHPNCVFENSMAGPLKCLRGETERPLISPALYHRYRAIYDCSKAVYDAKIARERREYVMEIVSGHDANMFLDTSPQTNPEECSKLSKLKQSFLRLGIIDEIVEILKVPLPQKFDRSDAKEYNTKMRRRMQICRIDFSFENVSPTVEKVVIAENVFQRMYHFLALAAKDSREIQNRLQSDIPFFFCQALSASSLASGICGCIKNIVYGRLDLASNIAVDLLEKSLFSALDVQIPAKLMLLRPFLVQDGQNVYIHQLKILELCLPAHTSNGSDCFCVLDTDFPVDSRNKASLEKWRLQLLSSHIPYSDKDGGKFREFPWHKDENWRHLLRVSSDIAHGGCAADSHPCASAFHLAMVNIFHDCISNNIDAVCCSFICCFFVFISLALFSPLLQRQKLVARLPFTHVLHILNTVCSNLHYRIWGYSFRLRVAASNEVDSDRLKQWNISRDPRLTFLNFDFLKTAKGNVTRISTFPISGLLKFIKAYLEIALESHLYKDIDSDGVARGSLDTLPISIDSDGVFGFITWLNIFLKQIINIFAGSPRDSGIGVKSILSHIPSSISGDKYSVGSIEPLFEPFETLESDFYRKSGDISQEDFDNQSAHSFISVVLYEVWACIYGFEADFESKNLQSKKMCDSSSFVSRQRDVNNAGGFCRPCWMTPVSHAHFTQRSHYLLALATASVLEASIPFDWDEGFESSASILGAFKASVSFGYPSSCGNLKPSVDDLKEALVFERLIELLIQKLHFQNLEKVGTKFTSNDVLRLIMNCTGSVRVEFQHHFVQDGLIFMNCLGESGLHTWSNKLTRSNNRDAALSLIQRKITHWNIIAIFDPSSPFFNEIQQQFSSIQLPVIRQCLVFTLVYNWGGWNGLGREIHLSQLKEIIVAVGRVLKEICQTSIQLFPTFVQRLFTMFETPKINSKSATEFKFTGSLFLSLHQALEANQSPAISQICSDVESSASSPKSRLKYIRYVGECLLRQDPSNWSFMDSFSLSPVTGGALQVPAKTLIYSHSLPSRTTTTLSQSPASTMSSDNFESSTGIVLNLAPVKEIVRSTMQNNPKELLFRFLGIDGYENRSGKEKSCFYGMSAIASSSNRNLFPQHLHEMVYNVIGVIGSHNRLPRGEDTNALILSSLTTMVQILYAGACVNIAECEYQLLKFSKCSSVLIQQDSKSLFARVNHLQECLVGLRWRTHDEIGNQKKNNHLDFTERNPVLVTDTSKKVALKSIQYIVQLSTPSSPTLKIRTEALRALTCILDSCSVAVLDQFLSETQTIQTTSNIFALSLADCIKQYENFSTRDDILVMGLKKFQGSHHNEQTQDEFVRLLISMETDVFSNAESTIPCIQEAYDKFSNGGYVVCIYSLRLVEQLCVISGKTTRAPYLPGQSFLELQPNSDPATVVNFQSTMVSLGASIASRLRIGAANVFDVRVFNQIFKALNSVMFGQSPSKMKSFLVADTYALVNKTVAGLSQRIDDIDAHYFPHNHPIHVFESLLKTLTTLVLSDIDGTSCKSLGKGVSWMNLFSLVSQVHSVTTKSLKNYGVARTFQSKNFAQEYHAVANRICDAAYIVFSSMKRQDITRGAQLEKDWGQANLQVVAIEARRRVSCVEIVRNPGFPELCFFANPETLNLVSEDTQRTLLCVEESRQLSLRKNLVLCERMRVKTNATTGFGPQFLNKLRNVPLVLTTLINLLLLGWLNLPIDFSEADNGWKWPQEKLSWELLFPQNRTYTYDVFQDEILPNILPLFVSDDSHKRAVNLVFLILTIFNIIFCFILLVGWLWFESSAAVYEYLLAAAYEQFVSPSNQSKKKVSLEELQRQASGKNYFKVLSIPSFWGYILMFAASICILAVSPLFSTLFVCDGFRFDGIAYIFGAFILKAKEFATLGYLAASIIFLNAVIGLVFFWDLFSKGESGSSECTSLFQCTLSFIVQGIGGISEFFTLPKDTAAGAPYQLGSDNPDSYRQVLSLLWQLLYFIVVPTCLIATVTGVIVDSFGNARQKKLEFKEKMRSECFVCGISAADFRDANLAGHLSEEAIVTFQDHVNSEHCVKDYFKLFMRLKSEQVCFASPFFA
jgi:hypothetical protein